MLKSLPEMTRYTAENLWKCLEVLTYIFVLENIKKKHLNRKTRTTKHDQYKRLNLSNDPHKKESANGNARWNVNFFHCYN